MIPKPEIMALAAEIQLQANVVEKDYALGWFLAGIAAHPVIGRRWVFKGGTCLKKCYFETYRFSEDLDFTLQDAEHLDAKFLAKVFEEIGDWVYDACGLQLPSEARKFEVFTNPRGNPSAQGRVGYLGPLGRAGDPPRIKLDLATDEVLVLTPVQRPVHHPYSDLPEAGIHVLSYSFEEVFAEKMRALAERQRPRVSLISHESLLSIRKFNSQLRMPKQKSRTLRLFYEGHCTRRQSALRNGFGKGRAKHHLFIQAGEIGVLFAPLDLGEAEGQIAQSTAGADIGQREVGAHAPVAFSELC